MALGWAKTAYLTICEPTARKCGGLDVSQPYGPPQSAIEIVLPLYTDICKVCADRYVAIGSTTFDG
jgi:hypothetical protein